MPEASFLKKTLLIIFIILTAFGTALLSVLSVMADTPSGMYAGIDSSKRRFFGLYGGECYALEMENAYASFADDLNADLCYGQKVGVTCDAQLSNGDKTFLSDVVTQLGSAQHPLEYRVERHGYFVPSKYASVLRSVADFHQNSGILLDSEAAEALGAQQGQTVKLQGQSYQVLAVFERENIVHDYLADEVVIPQAYYYVLSDQNIQFDRLYFTYGSSQNIFSVYNSVGCQYDLQLSKILTEWQQNFATVQTYYGYLSLLLGALTFFVLYALFSLIFRLRKTQICRLKLLGASNGTVASVYLAIALSVVCVAVAVATALSVPLGKFILDLCSRLFGIKYAFHFRVWIPLCLLGACLLLTAAVFAFFQRKISRLPIAEEVRYE